MSCGQRYYITTGVLTKVEGQTLLESCEDVDKERLLNVNTRCVDKWIENKQYSPDRAEKFRAAAREKLYGENGGKN